MSKLSLDSTIVRNLDQLSTDLGDETVILGLASGEYYSLEDVGARIWEIIQMPKTVKEIRDAIVNDYNVDPERCERDLLAVLQEMAEEGLVEIKNETTRQISESHHG